MIHELGDNLIPIFAIGSGASVFIVWIIAATIDSLHKTSRIANLKQGLMERGFSASEITQIICAKSTELGELEENPPMPPVKTSNGRCGKDYAGQTSGG